MPYLSRWGWMLVTPQCMSRNWHITSSETKCKGVSRASTLLPVLWPQHAHRELAGDDAGDQARAWGATQPSGRDQLDFYESIHPSFSRKVRGETGCPKAGCQDRASSSWGVSPLLSPFAFSHV